MLLGPELHLLTLKAPVTASCCKDVDVFSALTVPWGPPHRPSSSPLVTGRGGVGKAQNVVKVVRISRWSWGFRAEWGDQFPWDSIHSPWTSLVSVAIGSLRQVINLVQREVSWEGNENRGFAGRLVNFLPLGNKRLLCSSLISFPHASCYLLYLGWVLRAPFLQQAVFFFVFFLPMPSLEPASSFLNVCTERAGRGGNDAV